MERMNTQTDNVQIMCEFRVENRNEVLQRNWQNRFQIVRYFQELILGSQFLHLLLLTKFLHGGVCLL